MNRFLGQDRRLKTGAIALGELSLCGEIRVFIDTWKPRTRTARVVLQLLDPVGQKVVASTYLPKVRGLTNCTRWMEENTKEKSC